MTAIQFSGSARLFKSSEFFHLHNSVDKKTATVMRFCNIQDFCVNYQNLLQVLCQDSLLMFLTTRRDLTNPIKKSMFNHLSQLRISQTYHKPCYKCFGMNFTWLGYTKYNQEEGIYTLR